MISVAGMQGMTAAFNSDYASCKAHLMTFFDTLRQEIYQDRTDREKRRAENENSLNG